MDKAREIRAILSGRTYFQNGAYVAADRLLKINFQGINSGSFAVGFFGVSHLIRHYEAKDPAAAAEQAMEIFNALGRPVLFTESPEEKACLVRPPFGNPSVMVLEQTKSGLLLNVYTARTLLAALSRVRAVAAFEKHLPQDLRSTLEHTNEVERREKKSRRVRKAERKAAKWEKRAAKAEKHSARIKAEAQAAKQQTDTKKES